MSESSATLHEPVARLHDRTIDLHRALVSLQEELEAADWYQQRADACRDESLSAILEHNLDEELEHAAMLLEWLRRHHAGFAGHLDTYLYSEGPITEVEEAATAPAPADGGDEAAPARNASAPVEEFTVGPLKQEAP